MRDLIWTLIVIWLVYKLVAIFKTNNKTNNSEFFEENRTRRSTNNSSTKKDLKGALNKHLNNEGEYVDYEEVK